MSSGNSSNPSDRESVLADKPERLYKLAFGLPGETANWARASSERLWAGKTSVQMEVQVRKHSLLREGNRLRGHCASQDWPRAQRVVFEEFVSEAGHSTARVVIKDDEVRDAVDAILGSFECSWEIDAT